MAKRFLSGAASSPGRGRMVVRGSQAGVYVCRGDTILLHNHSGGMAGASDPLLGVPKQSLTSWAPLGSQTLRQKVKVGLCV